DIVTPTAASAKSPARRATSSNAQPVLGKSRGNSTSVTISSSLRSVVSDPVKKQRASATRLPCSDRILIFASSSTAIIGSSAAGYASDRLPPLVRRLGAAESVTGSMAAVVLGEVALVGGELS